MSETVLCIIDMQHEFQAAQSKPVTRNVLREIEKAKEAGHYVLVVEYRGFGNTRTKFLSALKDYPHKHHLIKDGCDGSEEIAEYLESIDLLPTVIKVCGVNTDQCVAHTVNSLASANPTVQVQVILDACNSISAAVEMGYSPTWRFKELQNISIVEIHEEQLALAV